MAKKTNDIKTMIRPCCEGFEPYVAGKPVETIKRELGLSSVVKLASNENPLGPSPKAVAAVSRKLKDVYFYPDSNSYLLKEAIAKKFRVPPNQVVLGAGSDEIIELIAKVFFNPGDEVIVSAHAFIRYEMAGKLMNCRVKTVPMRSGEDLTHDLDAMAKAITPKTKAIFIANPNNPTGTYNTKAEFERMLKRLSKLPRPPLVISDEAYYEYARVNRDYPEMLTYLKRYPNLVVLRTFSKIYALAGLRVGYGFASPEVVDYIERIRPPFNINSLAQVAAVESLKDAKQVTKSALLVKKEKDFLYRELCALSVPFVPSAANFILVDVRPLAGRNVFKQLLSQGVIVRAMDEYALPGYVRVSVGLPAENRRFVTALKKVLKEALK